MTAGQSWEEDILGAGFECRTLHLPPDVEGEVVATLVRREAPPRPRMAVLYVHGWSDYFFQTELADFWAGEGAAFYALDLRKYGRSLRPWQTPGYIDDLQEYDDEIDAALAIIREEHGAPLILMGHSTGGLTVSLWTARHPGAVAGLVLNSPWLEFQTGSLGRALLAPAVDIGALVHPHREYPAVDLGFYSRTVSASLEGEWTYNDEWRPERGFSTNRGWLHAVVRGHGSVAAGLDIDAPVLVLLSKRSLLVPVWSKAMHGADTAIDVTGVARRSADLGTDVTIRRFDGALHDVVLSRAPVREQVWSAVERWLAATQRQASGAE